MMVMASSLLLLVFTFSFVGVQSFLPILLPASNIHTSPLPSRQRHGFHSCRTLSCLFTSTDNNDDNLDDMRQLLEASWNADTMGALPTNPQAAATAAAESLEACAAMSNDKSNISFVDLLLPSYDIMQGPNMYDDVLAVEFCIALSNALQQQGRAAASAKSCILVRDEKTQSTVERVLDARERSRLAESEELLAHDEDEDDDDDDDDSEKAEFYDDFGGSIVGDDDDDVDAFRKQLMDKWDEPDSVTATEPPRQQPKGESDGVFSTTRKKSPETSPSADPAAAAASAGGSYRLASLFGNAKLSSGSDMMDQAIKAVAEHGQPTDEEDTIIILSAVKQDDMIAVRSLAAKYKGKKRIVLVNCRLDPLPRELIRAITVYSILPLVAKPVASEQNIFASKTSQDESESSTSRPPPPKIVVLRRFPSDWEVHVDVDGNGFELADTAKASQVGKKGPPMEWIAGCVKRYMESKLGRS